MIFNPAFKKFIIESLAIISSILIAFSIDSYWDLHKLEQSRKVVISALERDFEKTFLTIDESIDGKNRMTERLAALVLLPEEEVQKLTTESSLSMINALTTVYTYSPSTGSVDSLVSSGGLNKIGDHKLREALVAYNENLQSLKRTQHWALDTINLSTMPFLAKRIPMHLFSYNGPEVEEPVHDLSARLDKRAVQKFIVPLFKEIEFRNLAQNRLLATRLSIYKLKILKESVVEVCQILKNKQCS